MKVKLDENLPLALAELLRAGGHDVSGVIEEGLAGADDPVVLRAASSEGRILMTFDTDFANIRRYPPATHHGIVVLRVRDQRWQTLRAPVRRLLSSGGLDQLSKGLAIVEETRVRYRRATKAEKRK